MRQESKSGFGNLKQKVSEAAGSWFNRPEA